MEPPTRVLVVFVDALGPAQWRGSDALRRILPHGVSLRGEAGFSSGALATVLTGAAPAVHHRLCLFARRAPEVLRSPLDALAWLARLPRVVHERDRVRGWLARWLAKKEHLTGYVALHRVPPENFAWLDLPERDDAFQAERVGEATTFLFEARRAGLGVFAAPWQLAPDARWTHSLTEIKRQRPDLAFLYDAGLDAALHQHGPDAKVTRDVLDTLATRVEAAREAMGAGGAPVRTLLVGDHGMAAIHRTIDPRPTLSRLGPARAFVDSTMVRVWGAAPELARARGALESAGWPGRWIDADALHAWGVGVAGSPWGDGWFLLGEGALFAPSHVGGAVRGMHGYGPEVASGQAALCSDGPLPEGTATLRDVAPTIQRWLGVRP